MLSPGAAEEAEENTKQAVKEAVHLAIQQYKKAGSQHWADVLNSWGVEVEDKP